MKAFSRSVASKSSFRTLETQMLRSMICWSVHTLSMNSSLMGSPLSCSAIHFRRFRVVLVAS